MTIRPNTETSDAPAQIGARKGPMAPAWIPATLCVGLLIAAVYLGGRILTAHSHAAASVEAKPAAIQVAPLVPAAAVQTTFPPETETAPQPASPQRKSEAPAPLTDQQIPLIAPRAGEQYIQVGALDLEATRLYLEELRRAKLAPQVAPGPSPELLRILIGPFTDQDALAHAKTELDSAGIENFIRKY
jgi:cell division septation protein DedD